jgi:hypothetical protein
MFIAEGAAQRPTLWLSGDDSRAPSSRSASAGGCSPTLRQSSRRARASRAQYVSLPGFRADLADREEGETVKLFVFNTESTGSNPTLSAYWLRASDAMA